MDEAEAQRTLGPRRLFPPVVPGSRGSARGPRWAGRRGTRCRGAGAQASPHSVPKHVGPASKRSLPGSGAASGRAGAAGFWGRVILSPFHAWEPRLRARRGLRGGEAPGPGSEPQASEVGGGHLCPLPRARRPRSRSGDLRRLLVWRAHSFPSLQCSGDLGSRRRMREGRQLGARGRLPDAPAVTGRWPARPAVADPGQGRGARAWPRAPRPLPPLSRSPGPGCPPRQDPARPPRAQGARAPP